MQNTPIDSRVKREIVVRDYSRLDHLTEITVFLPIGSGTEIITHKIATTFIERVFGEPASAYFEEQVAKGQLEPIDADDGFFCPGHDWHLMTDTAQATSAIAGFDQLCATVTSHPVGAA